MSLERTSRINGRGSSLPAFGATTSLAATAAAVTASGPNARALEPISSGVLSVGDELGKGRFKRVHRGRYKRKDVVILRYSKDTESNELKILTLLAQHGHSQHVPEIYGVCTERSTTSLVQELATWGSLKVVLKSSDMPRLMPVHKLSCAVQIANSMAFLESVRVVHADLSCRNVLLMAFDASSVEPSTIVAKVTDFCLAVQLKEGADSEKRKQPQATRWCAPETIANQILSQRADVWSLGCTIWEMFANATAPWERRERRADVQARLRDLAETRGAAEGGEDVSADFPIVGGCPRRAHEAMLRCFRVDEYVRPTFQQLAEDWQNAIDTIDNEEEAEEDGVLEMQGETSVTKVASGTQRGSAVGTTATPSTVAPYSREETPTNLEMECAASHEAVVNREVAPTGSGSPRGLATSPTSGSNAWQATRSRAWGLEDQCGSVSANGVVFSSPNNGDATKHTDALGGRFKVTKAFLLSPIATEAIEDDAAQAMWRELDEAHAREAYLLDLVRRIQTVKQHPTPEEMHTPEQNLTDRIQTSSPTRNLGCSQAAAWRTNSSLPQVVPPLRNCMFSNEHLVPLTPACQVEASRMVAAPPSGAALGMWTLWSFVGPVLRRQDFAHEQDAWVAYEMESKVSPCMLRDPCGGEAAARNWVASYYTQNVGES
eukprot:TRINITY_DN18890_c0_g1_i1.p1 TRINITY_DN18890_c0_g1~~TRINITY_DN18890_c0_g1_i1.p1  ORF type:complete len:661 (+),score=122.75 TRINITY_DN18890_c0_g1_i1:72-2054(+)